MDPAPFERQAFSGRLFEGLVLPRAHLTGKVFQDCTFKGCSLVEATFEDCRFEDCRFLHCDLSLVSLPGCRLIRAEFQESKLVGIDWTRADWSPPSLGTALSFERCLLNHATFIGLELPELKAIDCRAQEVDFREADLARSDFSASDLEGSLFLAANLTQADFRTARNYTISPLENNLKGARFRLPEAVSLLLGLEIELDDNDHEAA